MDPFYLLLILVDPHRHFKVKKKKKKKKKKKIFSSVAYMIRNFTIITVNIFDLSEFKMYNSNKYLSKN